MRIMFFWLSIDLQDPGKLALWRAKDTAIFCEKSWKKSGANTLEDTLRTMGDFFRSFSGNNGYMFPRVPTLVRTCPSYVYCCTNASCRC